MLRRIKMKNKKLIALALILLIVMQCAVYAIAGYSKQYLHPDETLSLGLSQYHSADIQKNHDFFGSWHDGSYYKDYLIVNQDEVNYTQSVHDNQVKNGNAPLYYFFLRFYMEFSVGSFSMMTSIVLNVMLYTLITLMMFFIVNALFEGKENKWWLSLGVTAASTLILSTLSAVIDIGVYSMLTTFILLIILIHVVQNRLGKPNFWTGIASVAAVFLGMLTHYSFLIVLIALYILFLVRYIIDKSIKKIIGYTLPLLVGYGLSVYVYPESLEHLKYITKASEMGPALYNVKGALTHAKQYLSEINKYTFHGLLYVILGVILVCVGIIIAKSIIAKKNGEKKEREKGAYKKLISGIVTILVPTLAYFIVYSFTSLKIELKYIYPICALIFVLIAALFVRVAIKAAGKIGATAIIALTVVAMIILPFAMDIEPKTMYSNREHTVNYIEANKDLPTVYIYTTKTDSIMDDLYLLTRLENTYITRDWEINSENMTNVFCTRDTSRGVLVIMNDGQEEDAASILTTIMQTLELSEIHAVARLDKANIYYIYNNPDAVIDPIKD